jgi:alkylation response protein AidB-like acyl-CoA dehydrogenase
MQRRWARRFEPSQRVEPGVTVLTNPGRESLEAAREFAHGYVKQNAASWELSRSMPREYFLAAAEAGLCGLLVRPEQGGKGIGFSTFVQIVETLAYVDFASTFALIVHNNHVRAIGTNGTGLQVKKWLPEMIAGRMIGAFLLTEPKGGSDAAAIGTVAKASGDGFVLNGEKAWVTNATHADLLNVFAQTKPGSGASGIASFQVPSDSRGVTRIPAYDMLGGYAIGAGGFRFENVRVEADQFLMPPGQGFRAAMSGIDIARTVVAGMCCGMLQSSIDCVMPRLLKRHAFGKALSEQQGLQWQIADVATDLHACRLMALDAARLIGQDGAAPVEAAHAKKFATRAALGGISACMQAMGADGLKQEYPFARHLVAAKIAQYLDGTTEIQNVVISRMLQRRYENHIYKN